MLFVYRIYNKINDKVYVGLAKNPRQRWVNHLAMLRAGESHHPLLQRDFNEHGENAYHFEIIDKVCKNNAENMETYHINTAHSSKTLNIQKRKGVARNAFNRIKKIRRDYNGAT